VSGNGSQAWQFSVQTAWTGGGSDGSAKAPTRDDGGDGICDDTLISLWGDAERLAGGEA